MKYLKIIFIFLLILSGLTYTHNDEKINALGIDYDLGGTVVTSTPCVDEGGFSFTVVQLKSGYGSGVFLTTWVSVRYAKFIPPYPSQSVLGKALTGVMACTNDGIPSGLPGAPVLFKGSSI